MELSTRRRWDAAWLTLRVGWVLSLASMLAFAVLCVLELTETL
jgi:hypothetical protein